MKFVYKYRAKHCHQRQLNSFLVTCRSQQTVVRIRHSKYSAENERETEQQSCRNKQRNSNVGQNVSIKCHSELCSIVDL